mmetsp:Transcript_37792/g.100409  ORF Transcript_37792/g.100409 Transcript_37792/m.100409 type:complete len:91 (-) Transcript_37792:160-432(-)
MCSADWLESRLKILYKGKGDARDLNNWRGIMLIETAAQIVCRILGNRIQNFLNKNGLEEQNGFTPGRGGPLPLAALMEFSHSKSRTSEEA